MNKRIVLVGSIIAALAAIYYLLKGKIGSGSSGLLNDFTQSAPPPPDVQPPSQGENKDVSLSSPEGISMLEDRMDFIWNSNQRAEVIEDSYLVNPYPEGIPAQYHKPLHYARAGTNTFAGLPWKNSFTSPQVRDSLNELIGARDADFRNPDGLTDWTLQNNYRQGLESIFGFKFYPENVWEEWVKPHFGNNADGNTEDDWNVLYSANDQIIQKIGENMDAIADTLQQKAIQQLTAAGWNLY